MKNNIKNELERLIEEYGIEEVMNMIVSKNRDKLFIPNWYYPKHSKSLFGKSIKFTKVNEKWIDEGGYDYTNESVLEIWNNIND